MKELVGVIQVAAVGQCAQGDNLAGGLRIQKGARNRKMGLNLLDMIHGQALVQQGESSLTTCFHVFGANADFISYHWKICECLNLPFTRRKCVMKLQSVQ